MRGFLRRLFHDHRDDVIELLTNERDYLRAQLEQKDKEVLALTNVHAFRVVHREVEDLPPQVPVPDVLGLQSLREAIHRPNFTVADKEKAFEED